jgi:hypothetical protein
MDSQKPAAGPPKIFGIEMVKSPHTVDVTYTTEIAGLRCIIARLGYQRWSWRLGDWVICFPYAKDEHEAATIIEDQLRSIRDGINAAIVKQIDEAF